VCCGENITYPIVQEDERKITVVYSDKEIVSKVDEGDGVFLYFSKDGDIVKIEILKDDRYHIIYLR